MNDMVVRPEQPGDEAAIELATMAAFRQAPHSDQAEQFAFNARA